MAATFSAVERFEWQTIASGVDGDLAYTAGIERYVNSRDGGPAESTELRATHVFRREAGGEWRAVHRHADKRPPDPAELGHVIDAYRDALRRYIRGDAEATIAFFSDRDDVTLANPVGPSVRGPAAVAEAAIRAGANFREGGPLHFDDVSSSFEEVSRVVTPDLAYVLQIERHEGRMSGRSGPVVSALRATLVFRREGGAWRIVHRHADPITTERPIETVIQ